MKHITHCKYCHSSNVVLAGKSTTGKQRVKCKNCHRSFQLNYSYSAWKEDLEDKILILKKEGYSIRKTAAHLGIGISTVVRTLKKHKASRENTNEDS